MVVCLQQLAAVQCLGDCLNGLEIGCGRLEGDGDCGRQGSSSQHMNCRHATSAQCLFANTSPLDSTDPLQHEERHRRRARQLCGQQVRTFAPCAAGQWASRRPAGGGTSGAARRWERALPRPPLYGALRRLHPGCVHQDACRLSKASRIPARAGKARRRWCCSPRARRREHAACSRPQCALRMMLFQIIIKQRGARLGVTCCKGCRFALRQAGSGRPAGGDSVAAAAAHPHAHGFPARLAAQSAILPHP